MNWYQRFTERARTLGQSQEASKIHKMIIAAIPSVIIATFGLYAGIVLGAAGITRLYDEEISNYGKVSAAVFACQTSLEYFAATKQVPVMKRSLVGIFKTD